MNITQKGLETAVRTNIATRIQLRRKELKLSQMELSKGTGIAIATIKRIESGRVWPSGIHLVRICHYMSFNITL